MSDRLAELRRQRALVQEHLAWLDRELALFQQTPTSDVPPHVSPATFTVSDPAPPSGTAPSSQVSTALPGLPPLANPDAILAEYRVEPNTLKSDVRKGCFVYFAAALLVFALGLAGLWLAFRK